MGFLNEGSSGEGGRSQAFYFAEPLAIFPKLCWRWGGGYQGGWEEERDVIINNASGVPSDQGRGWSWTGQKHLATDKRDISLRVIAVLLKSLSYNSFS